MTHRVAGQVSFQSAISPMATGMLQRKCSCGPRARANDICDSCEAKEKETYCRRKAPSFRDVGEVPPIVYDVLRSPGQPLDSERDRSSNHALDMISAACECMLINKPRTLLGV